MSNVTTKQCLQFPAVSALQLLDVIQALANADFTALSQSELRVAKASNTSWRIFLPVRPEAMTGGEAAVRAFRDTLKIAYKTEADMQVGREAGQGLSVSMTGLLAPLEAAIILALQVDLDTAPAQHPGEKMILAMGTEASIAPVFADIMRQGRDVRMAGLQRLETGKTVGFLLLTDAATDYGTVSSHLRRGDLEVPTFCMVPHGLGFGRLWLEDGVRMADGEGRRALIAILAAARGAGVLPADVSDIVVLLTSETAANIFLHSKATLQDAPKAADVIPVMLEPVQPFDVTTVKFRPHEEAAAALADRIKALGRKIGYQVALRPMPRGVGPGVDIEPILEAIAGLQSQVEQITALGAPQTRLMRFTDAQLPCMIDGLRHLPENKLTDKSLLYAACHSAGRAGPVHYLKYDPQDTFMRVAEAHWRADIDPHPISYWLEPFVAHAQFTRPTRTQVFVPSGQFMAPSLAHFGGNLDDTLRFVLGNLFDDQQPLMTDKKRSACYVFTPSSAQDFRLEVEVLDGDAFRPLHQRLEWINDYLQVRSPVVIDAARLAEVATGLYEGGVAKALQADLDRDIKTLDETWSVAQARVEVDAFDAINMIASEMDAVSARMGDLHAYLEVADREMTGLETVAALATQTLQGLDRIGEDLATKDSAMARSREDFESRVETEVALAETLIESTEKRVGQLRDRLQRIKDWGAL
jgi:hypothetical protein